MSQKSQGHQEQEANARLVPNRAVQDHAPVHQQASPATAAQHAIKAPLSEMTSNDILALQRTAGNRCVQRMLALRQREGKPPAGAEGQTVVGRAIGGEEEPVEEEITVVINGQEVRVTVPEEGAGGQQTVKLPDGQVFTLTFGEVPEREPEEEEQQRMHALGFGDVGDYELGEKLLKAVRQFKSGRSVEQGTPAPDELGKALKQKLKERLSGR